MKTKIEHRGVERLSYKTERELKRVKNTMKRVKKYKWRALAIKERK